MNEKQAKFLELASYLEQLKDKTEEVRKELDDVMHALGLDTYVQDSITQVVYKIVSPKGTFVPNRTIDYVRTALDSERAGTLSKKEAMDQGFVLKKS